MATEFVVGGFVKKDGEVVATLRTRTEGQLDLVMTADGVKTLFDLIKDACGEISAKLPPVVDIDNPLPKEWEQLVVVPAAGQSVTLALGFQARTKPA